MPPAKPLNTKLVNKDGLCLCGCGQPTEMATRSRYTVGWVKGQPKPYIAHHKPPRLPIERHVIDQQTGCWVWQGATATGYGMVFSMNRGREQAHRLYYQRYKGPIPEGMELDHLCRNHACVNPDHLEPVTRTENVRRGSVAKLTIEQVREIRSRQGHEHFRSVAARYGITATYVHKIWAGEVWKDA